MGASTGRLRPLHTRAAHPAARSAPAACTPLARYNGAVSRWLLPLQSVALALLLAWPAPARFGAEAIGTPGGDIAKHVWNLWWARAEMTGGASGLLTTLVNWPAGMRLYPIEPLHSVIALLVPASPVALANALALLNLVALGLAAGWLGGLVTQSRAGAFTTAALAQGSSFAAFTLHAGVGELREVWWIPLGLGCLVRAQETVAWRWFVALGFALAGATLACFYHGLFLATAVGVYTLFTPRRDLVRGCVASALIACVLTVPVVLTFSSSYGPEKAPQGFVQWLTAPVYPDAPGVALDLTELLRPRDGERGGERLAYAYTGGRYIGLVALGLAVAGVFAAPRRARAWAGVAATGVVLAMGAGVWWNGAPVALPFSLPMAWLNRVLSGVAEPINFPARFLSITGVAMPVLAGLAVARWPRAAWLVPIALVDVARHDLVPWPRDTTALPIGKPVAAPPGAVADFTVMLAGHGQLPGFASREGALLPSWITPELRTRGIGAQIALDRPFQTVPIERQEMWALDGLLWTAALPLANSIVTRQASTLDIRASRRLLLDRGFGSILISHECGQTIDAGVVALLDSAVGPHLSGGCFELWPIPETEAQPLEVAAWREAQARRVAALPPPALRAADRPARSAHGGAPRAGSGSP